MLMETEPGMLACNKYDVLLPNRPAMNVAVTLEDPMCESVAAQFGRNSRADHCGLVFVSGLLDGPAHPIFWIVREGTLLLFGRQADPELTGELKQVVSKLLGVFFREVRGLVPELSLLQPVIGDDNLEKV
jgi:hypothetical protein